jgi:hypothetical protein
MKDTGVTHVEIIVTQYMNNIYDTYIRADGNKTPTDDAVISAINTAK